MTIAHFRRLLAARRAAKTARELEARGLCRHAAFWAARAERLAAH